MKFMSMNAARKGDGVIDMSNLKVELKNKFHVKKARITGKSGIYHIFPVALFVTS